MAFLVDAPSAAAGEPAAAPHPLSPLTAAEIETASAAVKAAQKLNPETARFVYISLYEPAKHDVIAFENGTASKAPDRLAKVVLRERAERATYEGVVRLPQRAGRRGRAGGAEVVDFKRIPGVQPSVMLEEFLAAEDIVRQDPRWQEAMRKRGIDDFDLCMIDPWSTPNVEPGVGPTDGRFVSPAHLGPQRHRTTTATPTRSRTCARSSTWTRSPSSRSKTTASSRSRRSPPTTPPPRSPTPNNVPYFPDGPRTDVKPFDIVQHEGPSFTVEDNHLEWQKWDLRIGFTPREGLVLHQINYAGRSIIYRASLSEMFVPYGDPGLTHYRKLVLDEGEYGIGLLTNSLELGCDCLGEIVYLDGVVNDNDGHPIAMKNAICLHEEDHGIAWKHTDFRTGYAEVRRMRRMVISSIVTVGNYEYGYYWYLYQDGSIEYEVKLSGVISDGAIEDGVTPEYGTIVAPGVYGPHHQHFFNVRLDMAVDGTANRVYEVTPTAMPEGPDNPVGNAWRAAGGPHRRRDDEPPRGRPAGRPLLEDRQRQRHQRARPAGRLQARARAHHQVVRPPGLRRRQAGRLHRQPALGHRLRPGRGLRHRRLPEPGRGRRRPARLRRGGPEPHRHRRGALVHLRRQPRRPPGGLAGHAGPPDRLPAAPGRLLRRQPGPRQPPARRRPLPPH